MVNTYPNSLTDDAFDNSLNYYNFDRRLQVRNYIKPRIRTSRFDFKSDIAGKKHLKLL